MVLFCHTVSLRSSGAAILRQRSAITRQLFYPLLLGGLRIELGHSDVTARCNSNPPPAGRDSFEVPRQERCLSVSGRTKKTRGFFNVWSPNQPRRGDCELPSEVEWWTKNPWPRWLVPRSSPTFTRARRDDAAASEEPGAPPPPHPHMPRRVRRRASRRRTATAAKEPARKTTLRY